MNLLFTSRKTGIFLLQIVISLSVFGQIGVVPKWGEWTTWGAQKDGTYYNPVLPADYSDIDCIRVGQEFYAISSTFQYSPGMVILRSNDLVNWTIIGHVVSDLNQLSTELSWKKMNRYGRGIWAGAIRYHNNKFWVYFGTPDEGYFMSTATDPAGPWSPLHQLLAGQGWDDCCPFWDDDGQGYLIGTDFRNGYQIHLFNLTADGMNIVPASDKIIHHSTGSEANKLYKMYGWYYHLFSEVRSEGRVVMMERARTITGPYLESRQLNKAEKKYYEPNQGGLIETPAGNWYFVTHHGTGDWSGRVVSLLPVTWKDGWPIIGDLGKDSVGHMVWSGKMPVESGRIAYPQTSDDFTDTTLGHQWEWNYQPRMEKWSLREKRGWLRLHAYLPLRFNDLLKAGNTLTQRTFRTPHNLVTIKIYIGGMADGQHAGLSHFGAPGYSILGVRCQGGERRLEFRSTGNTLAGPVVRSDSLWLQSRWGSDGLSSFYYSLDGRTFIPFGRPYQLQWGSYRGDRIAIYSYNNRRVAGYIDVDYLHYTFR